MTETAEQPKAWEPDQRRVDFVCALIEAMCWLWEDATKTVVASICERKLNAVWEGIWRSFPAPHQQLCAEVFWSAVSSKFPNRITYRVDALFGEPLNPNKDAKRVALHVRPAYYGEIVQINLRYPSV